MWSSRLTLWRALHFLKPRFWFSVNKFEYDFQTHAEFRFQWPGWVYKLRTLKWFWICLAKQAGRVRQCNNSRYVQAKKTFNFIVTFHIYIKCFATILILIQIKSSLIRSQLLNCQSENQIARTIPNLKNMFLVIFLKINHLTTHHSKTS